MSTFVRRYAKYINDKISSYKTLAIDLCKIKPGKDNALRTMNMENLTKTLPVVHTQFDSLLEFSVDPKDVNNGIIMAAFKLLYKDLNRIFAAYQEAIINLVERYFNLSRKKAREALSMYKKYLARMDKVAQFFKVVEQVGLDKSEMPDTSKLTSLLGIFEAHLNQLEAKKRGTTPSSPPGDVAEGDEKLTSLSNKENSPPEQEQATKIEQVTVASDGDKLKSLGESKPAETSTQSPAGPAASTSVKKQPPARPSTIVSPKVSPSEPAAGVSSTTATSASEKKTPPGRPAKPPSRPKPPATPASKPSVASPATATSSSAGPSPPPPHPPPPHPQPPAPRTQSPAAPEPPRASSVNLNDGTGATAPVAPHEGNGSNETSQVDGTIRTSDGLTPSGVSREDGTEAPACSGSEAVVEEVAPTGAIETNHISTNNVESNHAEALPNDLEPPPPPPPIEEIVGDEEVPVGGDNGVAEEPAEERREPDNPPVNDASADVEPPPPPPPIED